MSCSALPEPRTTQVRGSSASATGNYPTPWNPNPMFWVWMLILGLFGAIASALWHWLRRRGPVPPPNPA